MDNRNTIYINLDNSRSNIRTEKMVSVLVQLPVSIIFYWLYNILIWFYGIIVSYFMLRTFFLGIIYSKLIIYVFNYNNHS